MCVKMLITLNELQGMLLAVHALSMLLAVHTLSMLLAVHTLSMLLAVHTRNNHCETGGTAAAGSVFAFTPNIIIIFQAILFYKHILPP